MVQTTLVANVTNCEPGAGLFHALTERNADIGHFPHAGEYRRIGHSPVHYRR